MDAKYDLDRIRKKIKEMAAGRFKDPTEFRCPNAKDGETLLYRFVILPPLQEGEATADKPSTRTMEMFYVANGLHFVNNRPIPCPRCHDGDQCELCAYGFDLMNETKVKEEKSAIARRFLPRQGYAVNIYFLDSETNPEEYRGKVMWYNGSKTVYDQWEECLYRDNGGDDADPKAFGVFYDETNACVYQLQAKKKGDYNTYEGSKFLAPHRQPLAYTKDAKSKQVNPDTKRITEIINQRHDLYTKFGERDHDKLLAAYQTLVGSEDETGGFDEDSENKTTQTKSTATTKPAAKPAQPAANAEIAGEMPVDTQPVKRSTLPTRKGPVVAPKVEVTADDPEVQALLAQLTPTV